MEYHAEASVYPLKSSEGGRTSGYIPNGYRPILCIDGEHFSLQISCPGDNPIVDGISTPGIKLSFLAPELVRQHLRIGKEFTLNEGKKVTASGIITKVML
jgi:translation elongation factor EF-Tu-like GTPase